MKSPKANPNIRRLAHTLLKKRKKHAVPFPIKSQARTFVDGMLDLLFPTLSGRVTVTRDEVQATLILLECALKRMLDLVPLANGNHAERITASFFRKLPALHDALWMDARAIDRGDPASEGIEEVVLAYPGFVAIAVYRLAHELYLLGVPLLPRVLTEYAHEKTGIDIHPGATIGQAFFIDHGTGIVIGETTMIGRDVKLYQGVTLGALSVDKRFSKKKRHPTIEDHVTIYAQAVILGGTTVIGHHSVIGGNSWLTRSVPPYSTVSSESVVKVRKSTKHSRQRVNVHTGG